MGAVSRFARGDISGGFGALPGDIAAVTIPGAAPFVFGQRAAAEQQRVGREIQQAQLEDLQRRQNQAIGGLRHSVPQTELNLDVLRRELGSLSQEGGLGRQQAFLGGQNRAIDALRSGREGVLGELSAAQAGAEQPLGQLAGLGLQALPGATSAISTRNLLGGPGSQFTDTSALGAPIEADPGFQFELEQGQRALGAAASARGGRGGGRFAKELGRFSQGLASTRAQDVFNRRLQQAGLQQADLGRIAGLASRQAGLETEAGLQAQRGLQGLAQSGIGALSDIGELRAEFGGRRAGVMGDFAGRIAGQETATGTGLADIIGSTTAQQLGIGRDLGGQSALLPMHLAQQEANILLGAPLQGTQAALAIPAQTAGLQQQLLAQGAQNLTQLGAAGLGFLAGNPGGALGGAGGADAGGGFNFGTGGGIQVQRPVGFGNAPMIVS